ncbi:MAG: hypothetical protein AB7U83_07275 [Vicinamibacterales bacterium]
MRHVRRVIYAVTLVAAAWGAAVQVGARQAAPGAPANLTYTVAPGGALQLQWTHSTGAFTHYNIEAAGAAGAPPFLVLPTSAFSVGSATNPFYYAKLPELVPAFFASGVASGNYFVRIRGVNGTVESGPSNEIELPVRASCQPPAAPTNFGAIVRGTLGLFQWNPGSGGQPSLYIVQASFAPNDPAPPIQLPLGTPYFNIGIPPGTYYVRVVATNACGTSAPSNEILVTAPSDSPARTPDPPSGRLPQPYVRDLVAQFAAEARNLGYLSPQVACPPRAGNFADPTEARKTQRNPYIDYIVTRLRQIDQRFGFNAKPTRAWVPSIIAGDEIAYHHGSDASEGSPNVYLVDVLGGHCTGISGDTDRHTPDYRVFYDEFGRWTLAGLTP